jgi:hypothetical protein
MAVNWTAGDLLPGIGDSGMGFLHSLILLGCWLLQSGLQILWMAATTAALALFCEVDYLGAIAAQLNDLRRALGLALLLPRAQLRFRWSIKAGGSLKITSGQGVRALILERPVVHAAINASGGEVPIFHACPGRAHALEAAGLGDECLSGLIALPRELESVFGGKKGVPVAGLDLQKTVSIKLPHGEHDVGVRLLSIVAGRRGVNGEISDHAARDIFSGHPFPDQRDLLIAIKLARKG